MRPPVWHSLCCGLDAVASWAMMRRRPPVSRMGGKRAYSADVLRILGDWPKTWAMVDADPAIALWWSAVFGGWLGKVAERIRAYPLDGEALWRSIVYVNGQDGKDGLARVPDDPVDRLAAWLIAQKGNFSAKPLTWRPVELAGEQAWQGVAGFTEYDASKPRAGNWATFRAIEAEKIARKVDTWQGVAGYGHVSAKGREWGFPDRVNREAIADGAARTAKPSGWALHADLDAWAPDVQPGDLVTIDPPYLGTTGYGAALTRDRVVELALMADAAGARVLVHEAEPILDLGDGRTWWRWGAVDLRMGERREQNTWRQRGGNGTREVVTINFEPAGRLGEQMMLPT